MCSAALVHSKVHSKALYYSNAGFRKIGPQGCEGTIEACKSVCSSRVGSCYIGEALTEIWQHSAS